jgi:hypothetical protein
MLYWKEIINDLAKILTKYARMPGKNFYLSSTLLRNCVSTTLTVLILHNVESIMLYWNEINDLAKILTKYERMPGKKIIFPPHYYANCVSTTLTVLILHNVESVYFFYSNTLYIYIYIYTTINYIKQTFKNFNLQFLSLVYYIRIFWDQYWINLNL